MCFIRQKGKLKQHKNNTKKQLPTIDTQMPRIRIPQLGLNSAGQHRQNGTIAILFFFYVHRRILRFYPTIWHVRK